MNLHLIFKSTCYLSFDCTTKDGLCTILCVCSNIKKKVTDIIIGTTSINKTVVRGVIPADVMAAYDTAPKRPDAPVPDDQVETTFLKIKSIIIIRFKVNFLSIIPVISR